MGDKNYRILLVEDCKRGMSKIFSEFLFSEYKNLHLNLAVNVADVEHRLETDDFSAILLAPDLPHYDGTSLVDYVKKISRGIPLLVSLDSNDRQRIEDVKRLQVEKIFYDEKINLSEVVDLCEKYEGRRDKAVKKAVGKDKTDGMSVKSARVPETVMSVSAQDAMDVQKEILRHKEALQRAREESDMNRQAVEKARNEATTLREEARNAQKETDEIREKIAELKRENAEQLKIIAESREREESLSSEASRTRDDYSEELQKTIKERDELVASLQQLQSESARMHESIGSLNAAAEDSRKEIEQLYSEINEFRRRLEDSENKKNISLRDAQTALSNLKHCEEILAQAQAKTAQIEEKNAALIQERDKALDSSRLAGEYSVRAETLRDEALQREKETAADNARLRENVSGLTADLEQSRGVAGNLKQVVASLETRCEELEAGQAALIEAEHVGLQREREAREAAQSELRELKVSLGDFEKIEQERAKLEELLKEEQEREKGLIQAKTQEMEDRLNEQMRRNEELQTQLNSAKGQMESKNREVGVLTTNNERYERELGQKSEALTALESRVVEYKNILNELEKQHKEDIASLQESVREAEARFGAVSAEKDRLAEEKKEIMESYANKAEAVQKRLDESERMLKDCEWKLENEVSLKELALERVMELGGYEDQVGQLEIELAAREKDIQSMQVRLQAQKEEIATLVENEVALKDRAQLEHLEKEMAVDKLNAELEAARGEYRKLQEDTLREKDAVAANSQDIQERLQKSNAEMKEVQWKLNSLEEEYAKSQERIAELEGEVDALGTLHDELDLLRDNLAKSEKKILFLADENEGLLGRIEGYKSIVSRVGELEEKAELADQVAEDIERLARELNEEQIEHRRLAVELRKAQERESHLEELKSSNKELGWELMKARTLIGEYMAREEERVILESGYSDHEELARLRAEIKQKDETLSRTIAEKEDFIRKQLDKVAELTELYEKAQAERLELLDRLGRE